MLRTAGWLVRVTAVVVVGVGTFLHSPVTPAVLAAQATAFGVGVAAVGIWAMIDFGVPPMAGRTRAAPAVLALLAAASGVCVTCNGAGLIVFGLIAALTAGAESSLVTGWVIAGIGALAIEIGVLVWSPGIGTAIGYPLLLVVALLAGQTRRSYRLQAEQSAALLAQMEQLRAEQRQVAVLNERTRIAREIHDVLAHSLGALGIQIQAARAVLSDQRDVDRALGILDQAQRIAGDGLGETRRAIHALRSDARPHAIVVLTTYADDTSILAALSAGARSYLTMIGRGMTNAEIDQTLVLSNHIIKTHINRIFAKTGSANRTEASRFARAHGLT